MIRERALRPKMEWLRPLDLAHDLGVSRQYAARLIRRIPGAEMQWRFERRRGERWRVLREDYERWKALRQSGCAGAA